MKLPKSLRLFPHYPPECLLVKDHGTYFTFRPKLPCGDYSALVMTTSWVQYLDAIKADADDEPRVYGISSQALLDRLKINIARVAVLTHDPTTRATCNGIRHYKEAGDIISKAEAEILRRIR